MHPIDFHNAPMITLLTSDYLSINYSLLSWANLLAGCAHCVFIKPELFHVLNLCEDQPTNHAILLSSIIQTDSLSVWNMQIRGEGTPTLLL